MTALDVRPAEPEAPAPTRVHRTVVVWALIGVAWLVLCFAVLGDWVLSDDFAKAPVQEPDGFSTDRLVGLRILEALSVTVLLVFTWTMVIRPWRRGEGFGLTAWLMLGGIFGFVADASLNLYDYLFAWNQHSVNYGVWSASLPFHSGEVSSRYAEALLWGLPMYIYFAAGLGLIGVRIVEALRLRVPGISNASALAVVWVGDFVFDFVVENAIIRTTHAYSFARTQGELTLFDGEVHQFPLYESFLVACVASAFTILRLSALDDPDGLSHIERGALALPARLQKPMRCLATIGFSAVVLVLAYHLPFNWLSVGGESVVDLPTYLLPG